jgi:hypothetical protein
MKEPTNPTTGAQTMNLYTVSLYHGTGNRYKTTREIKAQHPEIAARKFIADHFPGQLLFELRNEQPAGSAFTFQTNQTTEAL